MLRECRISSFYEKVIIEAEKKIYMVVFVGSRTIKDLFLRKNHYDKSVLTLFSSFFIYSATLSFEGLPPNSLTILSKKEDFLTALPLSYHSLLCTLTSYSLSFCSSFSFFTFSTFSSMRSLIIPI